MRLRPILLPALLAVPMAANTADDPRLATSRQLAGSLQSALGGRLRSAIARDGAAEAIDICRREAPAIAAAMSVTSGSRLRRIALRARNPANAADASDSVLLEQFSMRLRADPEARPEHFTTFADGSARYLRAIVMQPLCLACHGSELAPEVVSAIAEHYPQDRATGFAVGEFRGALVVEWPAGPEERRP